MYLHIKRHDWTPQGTKLFCWLVWEAGCSQIVGVVSIAGVAAWECQDCEASHTCTCRRATILVTSWCCDWETLWLDHFTTLFDLLVLEFWSCRWPPMILNDSCVKKQLENLPNEVWRCGGQVSCSSNLCFHGRVMLSLPKHIRKIP